jgi:hypothetical protein
MILDDGATNRPVWREKANYSPSIQAPGGQIQLFIRTRYKKNASSVSTKRRNGQDAFDSKDYDLIFVEDNSIN